MAKRIKVSDTKAYRIEAIEINGVQGISIRQMYANKAAPNEWKPTRSGMFLPLADDLAVRILRTAGKMATSPDTEFTVLEREGEVQEEKPKRQFKPAGKTKAAPARRAAKPGRRVSK